MKKLRADSKWHGLRPAQREQVLKWLFDEGASYGVVSQRVRKQFGLVASISSVKRFYHHVCAERRVGELSALAGSEDDFRAAALKVLGLGVLELKDKPNSVATLKQLLPVVRLMVRDRHFGNVARKMELNLAQLAENPGEKVQPKA